MNQRDHFSIKIISCSDKHFLKFAFSFTNIYSIISIVVVVCYYYLQLHRTYKRDTSGFTAAVDPI